VNAGTSPSRAATADKVAVSRARVFIGLKVAPDAAIQLAELAAGLERSSVRLVAPADLHLTLVPPWDAVSVPEAIEKLRAVAGGVSPFWLRFEKMGYRPETRQPRFVWADCAAGDEIAALRAALLKAFEQTSVQTETRPFQPHVTLARIRGKGWSVARHHPIDQALSLTQPIESIELFRSPPRGESGYQVLASVPLGKTAPTAQSS
jgi:2'-5' RNA ligase